MPEFPVLHVVGLPPQLFAERAARELPGRELRGFESDEAFAAGIGEVEVLFALRPPRGAFTSRGSINPRRAIAQLSTARPLSANRPRGRFWMNRMTATSTRILPSTAPE